MIHGGELGQRFDVAFDLAQDWHRLERRNHIRVFGKSKLRAEHDFRRGQQAVMEDSFELRIFSLRIAREVFFVPFQHRLDGHDIRLKLQHRI